MLHIYLIRYSHFKTSPNNKNIQKLPQIVRFGKFQIGQFDFYSNWTLSLSFESNNYSENQGPIIHMYVYIYILKTLQELQFLELMNTSKVSNAKWFVSYRAEGRKEKSGDCDRFNPQKDQCHVSFLGPYR